MSCRAVTRIALGILASAVTLLASSRASAVVLYGTDVRNTSAPGSLTNTGTTWRPGGPDDPRRLRNSGWQWMGYFGLVTGIPIAPQYFVTAAHAGGIDQT